MDAHNLAGVYVVRGSAESVVQSRETRSARPARRLTKDDMIRVSLEFQQSRLTRAAVPSRQFRSLGLGRQGLGSHLCGRISVTRCISDHIRLYDGLYQSTGRGPMRWIRFIVVRSQRVRRPNYVWWSDRKKHKLQEQDCKRLDSGVRGWHGKGYPL